MKTFTEQDILSFTMPDQYSHKGQNGKVLVIGGSHFFHAASLWALTVASRIVDLVHYASVPENQQIVQQSKEEFRNGIVVPREDIERYIEEDDVILIGPGMMRDEKNEYTETQRMHIQEILSIENEGVQTYALTRYLLQKYPQKQWVIDAGSLQMLDISVIPPHAILTPHAREFEGLLDKMNHVYPESGIDQVSSIEDQVSIIAKTFECIILLKGERDFVCSHDTCRQIIGGNPGMTKGGTGDVLAGLVAAFAAKHDPFYAACCASFINKRAGDDLYGTVGPFFNASDLADQIPKTLKSLRMNSL